MKSLFENFCLFHDQLLPANEVLQISVDHFSNCFQQLCFIRLVRAGAAIMCVWYGTVIKQATILLTFLYWCEVWIGYQRHLLHISCLRKLLWI